jgi:hypothetical protein
MRRNSNFSGLFRRARVLGGGKTGGDKSALSGRSSIRRSHNNKRNEQIIKVTTLGIAHSLVSSPAFNPAFYISGLGDEGDDGT